MADGENEKKEFDYKAVSSKLYQASPRGGEKDLIKCGYVSFFRDFRFSEFRINPFFVFIVISNSFIN